MTTANPAVKRFYNCGFQIKATTVEEIIRQAHLGWKVSKRPILTTRDLPIYENGKDNKPKINPMLLGTNGTNEASALRQAVRQLLAHPTDPSVRGRVENLLDRTENIYLPVENNYVIVRDDINYPFAAVGAIYNPLDNSECAQVVQGLMDTHGAIAERAGTFCHGAHVWIMCRLPESLEIGGEVIDQYIRLAWSHDMTAKLVANFIQITHKNVIYSPEIQAEGKRIPNQISIRHTKTANERILEADKIMSGQQEYSEAFREQAENLLTSPCSDDEFSRYMKFIFPQCDEERLDKVGMTVPTADKKIADKLRSQFGDLRLGYGSNLWNVYRLVANHADNEKGNRISGNKSGVDDISLDRMKNEARLRSNLMGASKDLKQKAWNVLTNPPKDED